MQPCIGGIGFKYLRFSGIVVKTVCMRGELLRHELTVPVFEQFAGQLLFELVCFLVNREQGNCFHID